MAQNTERRATNPANQERRTLTPNVTQPSMVVKIDDNTPLWMLTVGQFKALTGHLSDVEWRSQKGSELGSVNHCRDVRSGVEAGLDGFAIVGRKYLMSPERYREALAKATKQRVQKAKPRTNVTAELESALRVVGGRR